MTKISDKVIKIVSDHLGIKSADVNLSNDIGNDLKGDSLDFSEILARIEEEFDIVIPDEDSEKMNTLGDMSNVVCYCVLVKILEECDSKSEDINDFMERLKEIKAIDFSVDLDFVVEFKDKVDSAEIKSVLE